MQKKRPLYNQEDWEAGRCYDFQSPQKELGRYAPQERSLASPLSWTTSSCSAMTIESNNMGGLGHTETIKTVYFSSFWLSLFVIILLSEDDSVCQSLASPYLPPKPVVGFQKTSSRLILSKFGELSKFLRKGQEQTKP